jgi:hypothetical protein
MVFTQGSPSDDFTIEHNLGRAQVSVTAYDAAGAEVIVGVNYIDANNVEITTDPGLPFSGTVVVL